jgi:pyruvate formate lyase activating enzyme
MELLGAKMSAQELAGELLKDRDWFRHSERGGVTLSGGESSAQGTFSREVLRLCREAGAHTALDTCGAVSWEVLARLYPYVDLVLYDLKEADPARHRAFTGLDNSLVLRNLEKTAAHMREFPMPATLWIRTPIVPGATDREENLFKLGAIIAAIAPPRLERWELCAFNNLCADKYRRLGKEWEYARAPLMRAADMDRLAAAARLGSGGCVAVTWTGSARIEPERNQAS